MPEAQHMEVAVLGAMLLESQAINDASMYLVADDFALDSHRIIFRRIFSIWEEGREVDSNIVQQSLRDSNHLDAIGGPSYLAFLTEGIPRNFHVESYAKVLKEKSAARALLSTNEYISNRVLDGGEDIRDILADQYTALNEISNRTTTGGFYSIHDSIAEKYPNIEDFFAASVNVPGSIATGYIFDTYTNKLKPSELMIIAARPSMGKTAWAINIATNAALNDDKKVGVFSLEMSKDALIRRALLSVAHIPKAHLDGNRLVPEEKRRAIETLDRLMASGLYIDDTAFTTLPEMRSKARRLKQDKGLDLLIIDYLQLIESAGKVENRVQEVSIISRGLKGMAKELGIPVICLAQLNRKCEERQDKRPLLSDLRESGSIEQDADIVAFIYRPEMYDRENLDLKGLAEIIIAKQREGPTGTIHMIYQEAFTRFEDRSYRGEPNA